MFRLSEDGLLVIETHVGGVNAMVWCVEIHISALFSLVSNKKTTLMGRALQRFRFKFKESRNNSQSIPQYFSNN